MIIILIYNQIEMWGEYPSAQKKKKKKKKQAHEFNLPLPEDKN